MEPAILISRELQMLEQDAKSRVSGAQASIMSQGSLGNGSKRLLLSSHNDNKSKKNVGEFVISYNFDNYDKSSAVTQNIFIGWDDELTTNKIKKNRVLNNSKSFRSKTPLRSRMVRAEKPILEGDEQNQIDHFETARNGPNHSLSKLGTGNKNYQPIHLSERKQNPFQAISRENYADSIDKNIKMRNINLKEFQNNQSKSSFEKNFVRVIPNSTQNTVRKENRPSMVDEKHNKNLRSKDFSSHLDNRVKLPSFDNPKTSSKIQEKAQPFKRGKTADHINGNNKQHKLRVDDYKKIRMSQKVSETSIGPNQKYGEIKEKKEKKRIENNQKDLIKERKQKSGQTKLGNKDVKEQQNKGNTEENIQNLDLKEKDQNDENNKFVTILNEINSKNKQNTCIGNNSQLNKSQQIKGQALKPVQSKSGQHQPQKQRKSEMKTVTKEHRISAIVVELLEQDNNHEKNSKKGQEDHNSESQNLTHENQSKNINVVSADKKVSHPETRRGDKLNYTKSMLVSSSNSPKSKQNMKNSAIEKRAKTNKSSDNKNEDLKQKSLDKRKQGHVSKSSKGYESEVLGDIRVLRSREGKNSEQHKSSSRVSNLSNVSDRGNGMKIGVKKETRNDHNKIGQFGNVSLKKGHKDKAKKSLTSFSEVNQFTEQSSDSDEQEIQKFKKSSAPKQITCISKKSSRMSNSSLLSSKIMRQSSNRPQTKASGRTDSRQSGVRAIVVKEYESIGIQNDGHNVQMKKKKESQSSIRSSMQKTDMSNKSRLSQRKSDKNTLNMKQRDSKIDAKKPIKKISQTSHLKSIDNLVSFGNISCQPKIEPHEKQSFLDIGSNMKLNQTDIPEFSQRRLNKNGVKNNCRDRNQYDRAPILNFIYGEEKERLLSEIESFERSYQFCPFTFDDQILDECQGVVGKALQIVLEIDSWLLNRIVQPYSSVDGDNQIWLYCKGSWKSFRSNNTISGYCFLREIIMRAMGEQFGQKDPQRMQIEDILKMITGLMVMKLKNKKKLSHELEYHLKKNHLIKGISYSGGCPTYNITGVETTAKLDKLIQIRKSNKQKCQDVDSDVMWIKEQTFERYFDYFVLICYREDSYWSSRVLDGYDLRMALVYTFDSICSSNVALEFHSETPVGFRMDLYREVKPKLLKFIGSLSQKGKKLQEGSNVPPSFHFLMRGRYYLMINLCQAGEEVRGGMRISLESTNEIEIKYLESIQNMTLRNSNSEYIEINSKKLDRSLMRDKQSMNIQGNGDFDKGSLKKQFIQYLIGNKEG